MTEDSLATSLEDLVELNRLQLASRRSKRRKDKRLDIIADKASEASSLKRNLGLRKIHTT